MTDDRPRREPADPREGMKCCVCGHQLLRIEWPQNPGDLGVCDLCTKGGDAA